MTPTGLLAVAITAGATSINVKDFQTVAGIEDLAVGDGLMVDGEIMRVQSTDLPFVNVLRGCADTIPASHAVDARVWFFSDYAVSDNRAYMATDTIGVKLLPFSLASGPVPIEYAPPLSVTFNWRFSRPYPPGRFRCNDVPWFQGPHVMEEDAISHVFTWAHRDRLLQADQLVGHEEASVGPEPGTTYDILVYDADDVLVRSVIGLTGETWTYLRADFTADVPTGIGRVILRSVRGGLESWQSYEARLVSTSGGGEPDEYGFGGAFGLYGG